MPACLRNASTPRPARPICCGPTSTCAHAGARAILTTLPPRTVARLETSRVAFLRCPMPKLVAASQFAIPDAAYVALVEAHRHLSDADAAALDTRLVLILA